MKIIGLLCTILFCMTLTANGQQQRTPEQRADALTEWMKTNLQLTTDQESTVHAINLKYARENEGLRTSTKPRGAKLKTLKANNDAKKAELKSVLTDEQFKIYEAKESELREKFKEEVQKKQG